MVISKADIKDIDNIMDLYCQCFLKDKWFHEHITNFSKQYIMDNFRKSIEYCIRNNKCYVYQIDDKNIISFVLCFDYQKAIEDNMIKEMFTEQIDFNFKQNILYILAIGTKMKYRKKGIASKIIDFLIEKYNKEYCLVGDVSNMDSLKIYIKRNFDIIKLSKDYYMVYKDVPVI